MSEINLPYEFTPRWYQIPFLKAWDSGLKRLILVAHRRMGKDKTVFAMLPKKMMERVGTYFYFLPTYSQAKKVIWTGADKKGFKFLDHFPKEIVEDINETDMKITLTNGSILQLVGADNIDRVVGTNPVGVVFSEFALMKPEVWTYMSPILAENDGWAVFIFTPRGRNHAYDVLRKAKTNPNWHVEILPVSYTKAIKEDSLIEERTNMTAAKYEEEYECSFTMNSSAVFHNFKNCLYPINEYVFNDRGFYQLGVDLAKMNDFTVIVPFDYSTFQVAPYDRFNQIDYTLQKAKIEAAAFRHNRARIVVDATGVGVPIVDDLVNNGLNVNPFTFTQKTRNDLLQNLQILLEQGKIKIPDDDKLIEELESFVFEETANGQTKMLVPDKGKKEGSHDDIVMALALAVWDIPTRPISRRSMEMVQESGGVDSFYPELGF